MSERKHYIDNLRWLWIIFLIPFHASMAWNNWEENYIWFYPNKLLSSFVIFIVPWYMPLLFVLAGMSARYAMKKRTSKQFVVERIKKLLIPLLTGIFTVVALMTYLADCFHNDYSGGFLKHYSVFLTKITDMTGYDGAFTPAHLWFLLYLFLISLISLVIILIQRKFLSQLSFKKVNAGALLLFILLPVVMTPILDFGGKSIGADLALFLIGYYVLSEEEVLKKLSEYCYWYLAAMIVFDVIFVYAFVWKENRSTIVSQICNPCAEWFGILGLLGMTRCCFNQDNRVTKYLTRNSFLIYIFHFGWLVVLQYYLDKIAHSTIVVFTLSVVGAIVMTLLTCELVANIPGVRFLFGVKKKRGK